MTTSESPGGGLSRRRFLQLSGVTVGSAVALSALSLPDRAAASPPTLADLLAPFGGSVPFSFTYGGTASTSLLPNWNPVITSVTRADGGTDNTVTWTHPTAGVVVTWTLSSYPGVPTLSWLVRFSNGGSARSAAIADVLAIDASTAGASGGWTIHTNSGSTATATDFAPAQLDLPSGSFKLFSTTGGRPTNAVVRQRHSSGTAWTFVQNGTATNYVNNTQHYSGTAGSSATLTFTGTSIFWIGAKNVDVGIADVFVDGVLEAAVDCYASSWLRQQTLFTKTGLASGTHTITVVVTGTANAAASGASTNIDAFQVGTAVIDDTDSAIVYADASADWTPVVNGTATGYVNNTQHYSGVRGSSASLVFTGTSVSWIGAKNVDVGIAEVYVDGVLQATVDCYASTWLRQQTLFTKSGLSNGTHRISVVVTATANASAIGSSINVDAFTVDGAVIDDADPRVVYVDGPASGTDAFGGWPYYNVDWGSGGLIAALGWPGQWALQAIRSGQTLSLRGGMSHNDSLHDGDTIAAAQLTNLWLDPGESIRTPSVVWQTWSGGDWIAAQNVWRQWFLQYRMPQLSTGGPVRPLSPSQSDDYFPGQIDTAQDELDWENAYGTHGATAGTGGTTDHWWIDAGWQTVPAGSDWNNPGTWDPDPTRYPNGLTPVNDRAHQLVMRTIVWFEPERVRPNSWLHDNHPEWLLKSSSGQTDNFLLDFADPAVQDWAIGHVGDLIATQHIDVYREDFNIDPLPFWNFTDPAGRRGITQIRYVEGHLRYWTTMQAQHPGLVIDTCASGGRRLDIETMSVAINLLRSDFVLDAVGNQNHQFGVSSWLALTGDGVRITGSGDDAYNARSAMAPSFHAAVDVGDSNAPWTAFKQYGAEWASIADDMYGDYYPLLPFDASDAGWMAWSFHRPATGTGYLQAFRRAQSSVSSNQLVLRGLTSSATYQLTNVATGAVSTASGSSLMSTGVTVSLSAPKTATTIRWHQL